MHARVGRYRDVMRAVAPGELPREGRISSKIAICHGAVDDPNPALKGKRQRVAINRQTDALEYEHSRGRLSESAYLAGRCYQALLERARRPISACGSWAPRDRVDQVMAHELALLNKIARAQDVVQMLADTRPAVGKIGEVALTFILVDGLTIKEIAQRMGGTGTAEVYFWGETFRRSLEALADHWCGPRSCMPRIGA